MKDINRAIRWPYELDACGTATCPSAVGLLSSRGSSHYEWTPDYYCLHIITRGCGVVETTSGKREIAPGMMFAEWPGLHFKYYEKPGAKWEFSWIHACGPGAQTFMGACGFNAEKLFLDKPFDIAKVEHIINGVWKSLALDEGPSAALSLFFGLPEACVGKGSGKRAGGIAEEAVGIMESLMHTGININEIADQLQIARASLFQIFKRKYDCAPGEYFEGLKISKAKDLLANTERSIEDVAAAIGFHDSQYFSRRFHRIEGVSPSRFRNLSRPN